nr:MFS transporter [Actinoplanes globisporus]
MISGTASPPRETAAGLARHRPLRGLLAAVACVLTAQRILLVALPWLVLTSTGSPTAAGLVSAAQTAPVLITKIFAGPLLDRVGAAHIAVAGDVVSAAGMVLLASMSAPPLWLIAVVMAAVGATDGPSAAAKTALLPETAAASGRGGLHRSIGLMTTVERAATTLGPALAGLLAAELGGQHALFAAAALFTTASLLIRVSAFDLPHRPTASGYWRQLSEGAQVVRRDRTLVCLALMFAITNWLDQALLILLFPLWARTRGHSPALVGTAISAAGATATLTALATAYIGYKLPRRATYLCAATVSGATRFVVLAAGFPAPAVVTVYAIAGLGSGLMNPLLDTVQLERIPPPVRGRALTLIGAVAWIGIPAGAITAAALIATFGLTLALWICAVLYLGATLFAGWQVSWHPSSGCKIISDDDGAATA